MGIHRPGTAFISSLLLVSLLCGCRAKPAPDSGFLKDAQLMKADKSIPYNRMWVNPRYQNRTYNEIYVAPVNTNYVMAQSTWEKSTLAMSDKAEVKKNVAMLAEYHRKAYINACQKDPKKHFKVVETPGPNTLILEMAIVQLVPSKAELQALGLVPIPFMGVGVAAVQYGASAASNSEDQGKGVIAMEARMRDGATGEVAAMFADRQHPPSALIDLKSLFWWEPAKPICDGWARQFVELANDPKGKKKVGEIPNFQLLVW